MDQQNSEKEEGELSSDDEYQSKFSEMQTYIPFLQQMIQRLEQSNDKSREAQLSKMKSLYGILNNTKKKLKVETLKRCEDVLRNLMNKVEKNAGHKEMGKSKKKHSSNNGRNSNVADASHSSISESSSSKTDSRSYEKHSDHEDTVSSTTHSGETDNLSDVVRVLKLAAARNTLRNLENVKTPEELQQHPAEDTKSKVSSSSPPHLVSSTSPSKQPTMAARGGLEQSRERLQKLMGHRLAGHAASPPPSPPSPPPPPALASGPSASASASSAAAAVASPSADWEHPWESFSSRTHSMQGGDSCDEELFTRRDERLRHASETVVSMDPGESLMGYTIGDDPATASELDAEHHTLSAPPPTATAPRRDRPSPKARPASSPAPVPAARVFSPERSGGDDSDRSDSGSGGGRGGIRAKLEQEIAKVHRVGVSTGGALRALAHKTKGDGDPLTTERRRDKESRPTDPRRRQSDASLPKASAPKPKTPTPVPALATAPAAAPAAAPPAAFASTPAADAPKKSTGGILTNMSQEELQRIVAENLRNLPSPPPITKEILESVRNSPKGLPSWRPPDGSTPLPVPAPTVLAVNTPLPVPAPVPAPVPGPVPAPVPAPSSTPASPDDAYAASLAPPHAYVRHGIYDAVAPMLEDPLATPLYDEPRMTLDHHINPAMGPVDDPRMTFACAPEDPRHRRLREDIRPLSMHGHAMNEDPRLRSYQDDPRMFSCGEERLLETRTISYNHQSLDPSALPPLEGLRRGSLLEDPRACAMGAPTAQSMPPTERRRGLLPTPPRSFDKYYAPVPGHAAAASQDLMNKFDYATGGSGGGVGGGGMMRSPEQQGWPPPYAHRQQQQPPEEQFSHAPHTNPYKWHRQDPRLHKSDAADHRGDTRDHRGDPRDHRMEPRDHRRDPRDHRMDPRDHRIDPRDHRGDPRDHRVDPSDHRNDSRDQRMDPRDHRMDPREQRGDHRTDPRAETHSDLGDSRDPRAARKQGLLPRPPGPASAVASSERDPRRRSLEEAEPRRRKPEVPWRSTFAQRDAYKKSLKEREKRREDAGREEGKGADKKSSAAAAASPLECLYGTVVPKTGKGYGFQNFRIPKIKRDPPVRPRPPTPPRPAASRDASPPSQSVAVASPPVPAVSATASVSAPASDSASASSAPATESEAPKGEAETEHKEVTQELIEALIRKSFESGEGKKLFEHARFFEKLSENLQTKKIRKIQKILQSESDSDSEPKEESKKEPSSEKAPVKSRARVIVDSSDSDDAPLAEKIAAKARKASEKAPLKEVKTTTKDTKEARLSEEDGGSGTTDAVSAVQPKVKKPAAKRRNALELLQQDIRDMFIREGVVTATGYRMCRLLKEVQDGASLDEASRSEAKRMEDEALAAPASKVAAPARKKPPAADVVSEDEPLSTAKRRTKRRLPVDDSDSDSSVGGRPSRPRAAAAAAAAALGIESDTKDNLRRRRVPRVVLEKTDLSKLRPTPKFNTESDEDCMDESDDNKKKQTARRSVPKKGAAKKTTKKTLDMAQIEELFFAREPYLYKKKKSGKRKVILERSIDEALKRLQKGEYLSVSLAELFPSPAIDETSKEKEKLHNKMEQLMKLEEESLKSDAISYISKPCVEVKQSLDDSSKYKLLQEGELDDKSSPRKPPIKLNLIKKKYSQKKKKGSKWKLGIIKKKSHGSKMKVDYMIDNRGSTNVEEYISKPHEADEADEVASIASASVASDLDNSELEVERKKDLSGEMSEGKDVPKGEFEDGDSDDVKFVNLQYAFNSKAKQTNCLLCSYEGKNIVQHYKIAHPESEVLISRLPLDEATRAATEASEKGYNDEGFNDDVVGNRKVTSAFLCRFCNYKAQYAVNFYEHTSSHTGEYRYQCCKCPYQSASRTTFKGHFYNHHPKNKLKQGLNLKVLTEGPSNSAKVIFGYLCSECNFVQLILENMEKHIALRHGDLENARAIRINMSKPLEISPKEDPEESEHFVDNADQLSDEELEKSSVNSSQPSLVDRSNEKDGNELDHEREIISASKVDDTRGHVDVREEKKPTLMEAFVPVSSEVDDNECVILETRVKQMQNIIENVNLDAVVKLFNESAGDDDDIVVLLENKIRTIKQESGESRSDELALEQSKGGILCAESIKKEVGAGEETEKVEEPREAANGGSPASVSPPSPSSSSPPSPSSEDEPLSRLAPPPGDENARRRVTRALSKTDEDADVDSGCETTRRYEVIEVTDESEEEDEEEGEEEKGEEAKAAALAAARKALEGADEGVSLRMHVLRRLTTRVEAPPPALPAPPPALESATSSLPTSPPSLPAPPPSPPTPSALPAPPLALPPPPPALPVAMPAAAAGPPPPPAAAPLLRQTPPPPLNAPDSLSAVRVATLEARLVGDGMPLFCCLEPSCVFGTPQASVMEKHLSRLHKGRWWNGVCPACDAQRVFGADAAEADHKYPLSFALEHLRIVHLPSLVPQSTDALPAPSGEPVASSASTASGPSPPELPADSASSDPALVGRVSSVPPVLEPAESEATSPDPLLEAAVAPAEELEAPKPKYIRMRRLSGDKLSSPSLAPDLASLSAMVPSPVTSASTCSEMETQEVTPAQELAPPDHTTPPPAAAEVSEGDSNILSNSGDDDDLPFLKIESVVSLHPSAGSNLNDAFLGVSAMSEACPKINYKPSSPNHNVAETRSPSKVSPTPVIQITRKLMSISGTSPIKTKIHLLPLSPASVAPPLAPKPAPAAPVGGAVTGSIPQPLLGLAQLVRPPAARGRTPVPMPRFTCTPAPPRITTAPPRIASAPPRIASAPAVVQLVPVSLTLAGPIPASVAASVAAPASSPASALAPSLTSAPAATTTTAAAAASLPSGAMVEVPAAVTRLTTLRPGRKSVLDFESKGSARTTFFLYRRLTPLPALFGNTRQLLSHKNCKTFEQAKAAKSPAVYQNMLAPEKLRHLFKCMAKHCTFTTNIPRKFQDHCMRHACLHHNVKHPRGKNSKEEKGQREANRRIETGCWPQCAYCCTLHDSPQALTVHIQEEHGQSLYQCAYCFFRAISSSYVMLHQNTNHTKMSVMVLLCLKLDNILPPVSVVRPRTEVIIPYQCNQGFCGLTFWNPGAFWKHLKNSHAIMTCYFCHICGGQYMKPATLLMHYKLHSLCLYQCQYCLHGADTREDMRHHLCNFHPSQKPHVIMRDSDPNKPEVGSEIERNVDELQVIDVDDVDSLGNGLQFPPAATPEVSETLESFWLSNIAFVEEYLSVDITNEDLVTRMIAPTDGTGLFAIQPPSLPNPEAILNTPKTPIISNIQFVHFGSISSVPSQSAEVQGSASIDLQKSTTPAIAGGENTENMVEEGAGATKSIEVTAKPNNPNTEEPPKSSSKSVPVPTKKEDCEVIVIDDASDSEAASVPAIVEKTPSSSFKPPISSYNDGNDSDVMIIGSDDEVIPPKKSRTDEEMPLDKSDPNYEPVVTLISKIGEAALGEDPLAVEQKDLVATEQQDPLDFETRSSTEGVQILNLCPEKTMSALLSSVVNIPKGSITASVPEQEVNKVLNKSSHVESAAVESDPSSDSKPKEPLADVGNKKKSEKTSLQSPHKAGGGKDAASALDPALASHGAISAEELAKTGSAREGLFRCGNVTCTFAAASAALLRDHLVICDLSRDSHGLTCAHCQRQFKQATPYLEHLKHHGTCRYCCFICKFRAPLPQQVIKHLKQKHRIYNSIVIPLNPQNTDPETGLFIVCSKDKTRPKLVPHFRNKRIFNPDEVNFLPVKYISYHPLTCNVCNFRTKVVGNMRRHLNFHNNKVMDPEEIPGNDPVNPVPCLEKKEMMFDKMTNLAASSHPLGRMGGKPTASSLGAAMAEQLKQLPKFVPENERYVCGSAGCSYMTCDEAMLRCHMRALHCEETAYRCPHCPAQRDPVPMERLGTHLRMHDARLYKCAHCPYAHFQRHLVERHLADRHPEKRPFVQVVREEGGPLTDAPPSPAPAPSPSPSPAPSPAATSAPATGATGSALWWMCGLCQAQYPTRAELTEHTSAAHNIKSQFKCALCSFKSSSRPNSETHFASRHPGEPVDLINMCQRVPAPEHVPSPPPAPSPPPVVEEEPPAPPPPPPPAPTQPPKRFDTTPLWLRNMVRIRHIRGVLLEDEEETRRHIQQLEEGTRRPRLPPPPPLPPEAAPISDTEEILDVESLPIVPDPLEEKFGPYGKPVNGNMFFCTLCNKYKTRFKGDMKEHLYRELNYVKWMCKHCSLTSCSRYQIQKHSKIHEKENKPERIVALQGDSELETWVERLLTKQHHDMKGVPDVVPSKSIATAIKATAIATASKAKSSPGAGATTPSSKNSSPAKTFINFSEDPEESDEEVPLVAIAPTAHKRKLSLGSLDDEAPSKKGSVERRSLDSRENESTEVIPSAKKIEKQPGGDSKGDSAKDQFRCKDCNAGFAAIRGLKLHIRFVHLCLGSYSCGYCGKTGYSESSVKQHSRSQHPGQPEVVNHHKGSSNLKINDEFWEREYGIKATRPEESSGAGAAKRPRTSAPTDTPAEGDEGKVKGAKDDIVVLADLSADKAFRMYSCGVCTFEAPRENDVRKHWARVHPHIQPPLIRMRKLPSADRVKKETEDSSAADPSPSPSPSPSPVPAPSDDVDPLAAPAPPSGDAEGEKMFRCFYCPLRATALAVVHSHWEKTHKARALASGGPNMPFRYKEMSMQELVRGRRGEGVKRKKSALGCGTCGKRGSLAALQAHCAEAHPGEPPRISALATRFECAECAYTANAAQSLRKHFEAHHPQADFRYMVRTVTQPVSAETGCPDAPSSSVTASEVEVDIAVAAAAAAATEGPAPKAPRIEGTTKYMCSWCGEKCVTEAKIHFHHTMYHSHLKKKFTVIETADKSSKKTVQMFLCPRCNFKAPTLEVVHEHLRKHCRQFRCGHCSRQFELPNHVRNHSTASHPNLTPKIISAKEQDCEMATLKTLVVASEEAIESEELAPQEAKCTVTVVAMEALPSKAFARKSTGRRPRLYPVARKSTNPVPRQAAPKRPVDPDPSTSDPGTAPAPAPSPTPTPTLTAILTSPAIPSPTLTPGPTHPLAASESSSSRSLTPPLPEFSFYGKKPDPVDLKKIRATVNYAGVHVQVNVANMAAIFNLNPVVLVRDLKTDWKPF